MERRNGGERWKEEMVVRDGRKRISRKNFLNGVE